MHKLDYATPEARRFWQKHLLRPLVDFLDQVVEFVQPQNLLLPLLVLIMVATAILLVLARTLDLR